MVNSTLFISPAESERVSKTVQNRVQQLEQQKGQPRSHKCSKELIEQAVSASLMRDLSFAALNFGASKTKETMTAYGIGKPYFPCKANIEDLEPMRLSDLRMETHHRGLFLSLRRVSPVAILEASSWAVVQEASSQDAERLELFLHQSQYGSDILDTASEMIVKEPYFTLNNQGEQTIRVDHPSDLIITEISESPEAWRESERWTAGEAISAEFYKRKGNNALLKKKNLSQAYFYYTKGLELLSNGGRDKTLRNDLHRNRAHVNLELQRFDEAKSDAISSINNGDSDELRHLDAKAYNRAGRAAYAQGEYMEARRLFEQQESLQAGERCARAYIQRISIRIREQTDGMYNMGNVISSLSKTGGRPDVASYNGPTAIKDSPGAGRGLFATRDIQPNEIIICEKAFCVAWSHEPETFSALVCDVREDITMKVYPTGLHKAVVRKLINNPSQVESVLNLYGDYKGIGKKLLDGVPIIDTFRIHDIVQRNAFGLGQQTADEDISNASTGLWIRASYINHSCVPNTKKDFVGDLLILRATHRIAAGEEITHSYDESSDYEIRKAFIRRTWNFKCRCQLCVVEEAESEDMHKRRREAEEKANDFAGKTNPAGASGIMVRRAKVLRSALNETYDAKRYKRLPRRGLAKVDEWLLAARVR
ncbi:n-lysine methyltransferase smyd2 [Fusarium heterosporum]|uniref:N-lysine methyltransferase smyd2 n=1 Tax=Fusarium heterosporum TaxID=42747 RepID=A0A8H5STH2_FUSHE|nr:n-lysine methyltransferase smyd2 [Fusarium heterosporum]